MALDSRGGYEWGGGALFPRAQATICIGKL